MPLERWCAYLNYGVLGRYVLMRLERWCDWTTEADSTFDCVTFDSHVQGEFIHTRRIPEGLASGSILMPDIDVGLLHFQFVNWPNFLLKQVRSEAAYGVCRSDRLLAVSRLYVTLPPSQDARM